MFLNLRLKPKFYYTDQTGPDPTTPDPTRHCDQVSDKSGPYKIPLYGPDPTEGDKLETCHVTLPDP